MHMYMHMHMYPSAPLLGCAAARAASLLLRRRLLMHTHQCIPISAYPFMHTHQCIPISAYPFMQTCSAYPFMHTCLLLRGQRASHRLAHGRWRQISTSTTTRPSLSSYPPLYPCGASNAGLGTEGLFFPLAHVHAHPHTHVHVAYACPYCMCTCT